MKHEKEWRKNKNMFGLRKVRISYAPVLRWMRETYSGQVPVERVGPSLARWLCTMFRLPHRTTGQVLLKRGKVILQKRFLQVGLKKQTIKIITVYK